jgi:hypothetical protein
MRTLQRLTLALLLTAAMPSWADPISPSLSEDVIYKYTGNTYTGFNCSTPDCGGLSDRNFITVVFALPIALPARAGLLNVTDDILSFRISDGVHSYMSGVPGESLGVNISTDHAGKIIDWVIIAPADAGGPNSYPFELSSFYDPPGGEMGRDGTSLANNNAGFTGNSSGTIPGQPGRWTITTTIPECSTLLLLTMVGLALLLVRTPILLRG